ncbi:hypothetical protein JYU16_01975, partial [bacterium AH-315-M05]|nr:hypothetical protein [bacterium AH-315-M05]
MKKKILLPIVASILAVIASYELSITNSTTPPVSRTGAPGETTCAACHGNLNIGPGDILFSLDTISYFPGVTYTATVQVIDPTKVRWGFELTSLDGIDNMAGSYTITNVLNTSLQTNIGRDYINHLNASSSDTWQFDWTAPGSIVGPITFYIAGNAADNNASSTGDNIYTRSFVIQADSSIITGITSTDVTCFGFCDGSATANPVGGFPPYAYQWDDVLNQTTQTATGLCAGTYTVIVTDTLGQTDTASVAITEPVLLSLSISKTDISCFGVCDGAAIPAVTGGTLPYTYLWLPGGNGLNLCAGIYTLTVTDANGCDTTVSVTITEPPPLVVSITSSVNIDCFGNCNGFAQADATGGTPPYTYMWNTLPVTIGDTLSGLCPAGTYCVTVTDANGCSDSACVTITEPPVLIATLISSTNVSCNGLCDGSATFSASGGTPPYAYVWNTVPVISDSIVTGLCPGTYCGTVMDANGCTDSVCITITQPPILTASGFSLPATCGNANGVAGVNPFGGILPYTYLWNPTAQTDSIADSLLAGSYNVTITDSNGCTFTLSITVVGIAGPTIDSIITTDVFPCSGVCNGTAIVYTSSGTAPFTYVWQNSSGDTVGTNADSISGLCAGTYTISVSDSNGCITSAAFIINAPAQLNSAIFASDVSCNGLCDGDAFVSVAGGSSPYTYLWSNGDTGPLADSLCAGLYFVIIEDSLGCVDTSTVFIVEPALLQITPVVTDISCFGDADGAICMNVVGGTPFYSYVWSPPVGNSFCVTNLPAGNYCVTVTDMSGCTADTCVTVNEPTQITATVAAFPSTCGNANGVVFVIPFGGTPPYTYLWNDPAAQTNDTATGLYAGCYNVLITDANGCTTTIPICVGDVPGPVIDSVIPFDFNGYNVDCYGNSTGSATAFVSSGVLPYTYSWNTNPLQDSITVTGLAAGIYIVTVTDANGCIAIDSVIINEPDSIVVITSPDTTICSGDSVQISYAIFGGVNPFINSGNLNNGAIVSPDTTTTYIVVITDNNGCGASDSVTVTIYPPLSSSVSAIDDTICAGASATLTASASGGNGGPYTYTWLNDGSTDSAITASPTTDSIFTVVVSDGGCSINDTSSAIVVVEICSGISEFEVQSLKFKV